MFEIGLLQLDSFEMKPLQLESFANRSCGMSDAIRRSKIIILSCGCNFKLFGFFIISPTH